jgi:hypothetical protein
MKIPLKGVVTEKSGCAKGPQIVAAWQKLSLKKYISKTSAADVASAPQEVVAADRGQFSGSRAENLRAY